jgi:hypothetical protein
MHEWTHHPHHRAATTLKFDLISTALSTAETQICRLTTNTPDRASNLDTARSSRETGQLPFRLNHCSALFYFILF